MSLLTGELCQRYVYQCGIQAKGIDVLFTRVVFCMQVKASRLSLLAMSTPYLAESPSF